PPRRLHRRALSVLPLAPRDTAVPGHRRQGAAAHAGICGERGGTMSLDRLATALSDRYALSRELGAGGMATVYLARDLKHDREVAVKVLRPDLGAVLGADRFLEEIKITARLDHPHILTLIDSGATEGMLYYVLPYVR